MYFVPMRHQKALDIIDKVMKAAIDYANTVGNTQKLKMRVEQLRFIHLGPTAYKLQYNAGAEKTYTMNQNCGIFLAGIWVYDSSLTEVKIRKGQQLLVKWTVYPVYKYQEQMGIYAGNTDQLQFRSGESMGLTLTGPAADPDAWLYGFAVMPEAQIDSKIVT